jgi:hypothetical protein
LAGSLIGDNEARGQTVTVNVTDDKNAPATGSPEWCRNSLPRWKDDYLAQFEAADLALIDEDLEMYDSLTDPDDKDLAAIILKLDWMAMEAHDQLLQGWRVI